ncbi:U3 small nucleolar RNA-associated protein 4 homolog [Glandiceps talaboti]
MGDFRVHLVRFFNFTPKAIHCLAHEESSNRLAVSRSDGSIEIWSINDNWYHEKTIPGCASRSVEALLWVNSRLFSAGLHGDITEYDLKKIAPKVSIDSIGGAVWCMTVNKSKTHIAAGMEDGCIRLFEITDTGLMFDRALNKQDTRILSIAWHDAEDIIVSGSIDNIRIWNVHTGHVTQRITLDREHNKKKETIVWSVAITKDFTIISSDSAGKVRFWDARHGTLLKSFYSHKADVLTLCVNKEEDTVYAAGVDPKISTFQYVSVSGKDDNKTWVQSKVIEKAHTHDIRALAVTEHFVISGGVDTFLVANPKFSKKVATSKVKSFEQKTWKLLSYPHHKQLVHIAADAEIMMFQFTKYLEFWKLGASTITEGKDGEVLPLVSNPVKLLQLQAKGTDHIVCSAISKCGCWVAYSDANKVRMYNITMETLSVSKVPGVPVDLNAAHCMVFTADSSRLLVATNQCTIQVVQVDSLQPSVLHTFHAMQEPIHLLSVSSDGHWLAAGNHGNHINVYNIQDYKLHCSLPTLSHQPSALAFNPHNSLLVAAYCNQKIVEYDIIKKEYTHWSKRGKHKLTKRARYDTVCKITFSASNPDLVFLQDVELFAILDKRQYMQNSVKDGKPKDSNQTQSSTEDKTNEQTKSVVICLKYKPLLFMDTLKDNYLVAVQRPLNMITETLPGSLRQKKFGT